MPQSKIKITKIPDGRWKWELINSAWWGTIAQGTSQTKQQAIADAKERNKPATLAPLAEAIRNFDKSKK